MSINQANKNDLQTLVKSLSHVYIKHNDRLFVSRSRIEEYIAFMTDELNAATKNKKVKFIQLDDLVFDEDINPNFEIDIDSMNELLDNSNVAENIDKLDQKSVKTLIDNLSSILFRSYNNKVLSYVKSSAYDCADYEDFDIDDDQSIQQFCYRIASRLSDFQFEEY